MLKLAVKRGKNVKIILLHVSQDAGLLYFFSPLPSKKTNPECVR